MPGARTAEYPHYFCIDWVVGSQLAFEVICSRSSKPWTVGWKFRYWKACHFLITGEVISHMFVNKCSKYLKKGCTFLSNWILLSAWFFCVSSILVDYNHSKAVNSDDYIIGSKSLYSTLQVTLSITCIMLFELLGISLLIFKARKQRTTSIINMIWGLIIFVIIGFFSFTGLITFSSMRETTLFLWHFLWIICVCIYLLTFLVSILIGIWAIAFEILAELCYSLYVGIASNFRVQRILRVTSVDI